MILKEIGRKIAQAFRLAKGEEDNGLIRNDQRIQ